MLVHCNGCKLIAPSQNNKIHIMSGPKKYTPKRVKNAGFCISVEFFSPDRTFYTDTARGARDNDHSEA